MAGRHQRGAENDGAALAEHAVGEQPAENRREINEPGIEAVDLRGQRLQGERPEYQFQHVLERSQSGDIAGLRRQQQVFDHVEHEQRAHPVIGEALPHLGREQEGQSARMTEQVGWGFSGGAHIGHCNGAV